MNLKDKLTSAYQAFVHPPVIETEVSDQLSPYHDRFALLPWNPDDLVSAKRMTVYEDMQLKDEQVKACLFLKKHAVLSSGFHIDIGEDTTEGEKQKRYLEYAFGDGMPGNFMRVMMGLQSAYAYGFSISEKVYQPFTSGPFAGMIGLKAIKTRPPDSFDGGLITDVHGNLIQIIQAGQSGTIDIPINKVVNYPYNSEFDNPYGNSDLRAAYRFYFAKDMIIKFWNIFLERFGMPLAVGSYEKGTGIKERQKFKKVIKNLQAKTGIIIPKNMEMNFLEATRKGEAGYKDAIQEYNKSIARSILIPDLMGFTDTKFGSRALGTEQGDVFSFILGFLKQELQEIVFEQIIRELIDWNFGPQEKYPKLVLNPLSEDNKNELTKLIIEAKEKGVIIMSDDDEAHVREMLNLPKKRKDDLRPAEPVDIDVDIDKEAEDIDRLAQPKRNDISLKEYYREGNLFLSRPLNKHEQKFDFVETEDRMTTAISDDVKQGSKILTVTLEDLISKVVNDKIIEETKMTAVNDLKLTQMSKLEKVFNDGLKETYIDGEFIANDAIKKKNQNFVVSTGFGVPPNKAIAWFNSQKFIMTDVIDAKLLERSKQALIVGMRSGKTTKEVVNHLEEIFQPYISGAVEANRSFDPWALTNVIRTNYNTAFNRGLEDEYKSTDLVEAFMYSAVLDVQTTDYCRAMDQQVFTKTKPGFVFPSAHFQCRSDVVPILTGEPRQLSDQDPLAPKKVKVDDRGKIVTKNGVPVRTSETAIRTKEFGGKD